MSVALDHYVFSHAQKFSCSIISGVPRNNVEKLHMDGMLVHSWCKIRTWDMKPTIQLQKTGMT